MGFLVDFWVFLGFFQIVSGFKIFVIFFLDFIFYYGRSISLLLHTNSVKQDKHTDDTLYIEILWQPLLNIFLVEFELSLFRTCFHTITCHIIPNHIWPNHIHINLTKESHIASGISTWRVCPVMNHLFADLYLFYTHQHLLFEKVT